MSRSARTKYVQEIEWSKASSDDRQAFVGKALEASFLNHGDRRLGPSCAAKTTAALAIAYLIGARAIQDG